ncbi:MAG: hypothetical protein J7527_20100 [Chitinophagaceae bacterium]|nr:hypothetical protein [Chitinophagaceae bacterium]
MKPLLLTLLMFCLFAGCKKATGIKCEGLVAAIQEDNVAVVKSMITAMAAPFEPRVSGSDPDGHYQSYLDLIGLLNDCGLRAVGVCYGCVNTLPATSEIRLSFGHGVGEIVRVIDLAPDASNRFVCTGMHQ